MPNILNLNTREPQTESEYYSCTKCGHEIQGDETLASVYLHETHGLIVAPPENLCSKCLEERISDYNNFFKPVA